VCNGYVYFIIGFDYRFFRFKKGIIADDSKSVGSTGFFEIECFGSVGVGIV
jgi:hypothetical protein